MSGWGDEEQLEAIADVGHQSETRTVTITVTAPANFAFVTLDSCDVNQVSKSSFSVGEPVYLKTTVRNNGATASTINIRVSDADTGTALSEFIGTVSIPAGGTSSLISFLVGSMPNKTWRLKCELTP